MEDGKADEFDTEEEEEIYVYVKFDELIDNYSKEDLIDTKLVGLDTEEPILQIGNKVFGGSWNETVGTALFFEETSAEPKKCLFSEKIPKPLKYLNMTTKLLDLKRIFISQKATSSTLNEEGDAHTTDSSDNDTSGDIGNSLES